MVDVVALLVLVLALLSWMSLKGTAMSQHVKDAIGFALFFLALAFIAASRDPVLIVIALLFLAMKVLTTGAKPPKKFEDNVRTKWFPQYP